MLTLDPAAIPQLPSNLDELDPLEALQLVATIRDWTLVAYDEQMCRARIRRLSWRAIAAASGVNASTVRRWALMGAPADPRRRS